MPKRSFLRSWIPTALVAALICVAVVYAKSRGLMNDYWYQVRRLSDGLIGWSYGYYLKLEA